MSIREIVNQPTRYVQTTYLHEEPELVLLPGRPLRQADEGIYRQGIERELERPYMKGFRLRESTEILSTLKILRDTHPDVSMAVNNFLRLTNRGYTVRVWQNAKTDSDTAARHVPDPEGQELINNLVSHVGQEYGGGMGQLINVMILTLLTQGAAAMEVELDEGLDDVLDFHLVDPARITFKRDKETYKLVPGFMDANRNWKPVNSSQFRYMPLDPDVDNPYGRSPILSVLTTIFFQIRLLKNLEMITHAQGNPRVDISLVQERVIDAAPPHLREKGNEDELRAFLRSVLQDAAAQYSNLMPDDAYFHWDFVKVSDVTASPGALNLDVLIDIIDTQLITGLKMLPVLLGRNTGTSETHATVQAQIMSGQIMGLQSIVKGMFEWALNLALTVYGRQSHAVVELETPRSSDRLNEANAQVVEGRIWGERVDRGWADNDEAAQAVLGHPAVAAPKDELPAAATSDEQQGENAVEEDSADSTEDEASESQ